MDVETGQRAAEFIARAGAWVARDPVLNTERSNPTSNAVYRRIGYVDLADQVEIAFV